MVASYFTARYAISKDHCPRLVKEEFQLGLRGNEGTAARLSLQLQSHPCYFPQSIPLLYFMSSWFHKFLKCGWLLQKFLWRSNRQASAEGSARRYRLKFLLLRQNLLQP
jgi:hypothetical protein